MASFKLLATLALVCCTLTATVVVAHPDLTLFVTDNAGDPTAAACDGTKFGGLCPYRSWLSDVNEKQVGNVAGFCTYVIPVQDDESFEQICYGTYFLGTNPDTVIDSISVQGHFTAEDGNRLAITGGTGKYAGARGFEIKSFASQNGDLFTYQHDFYFLF